MQKINFQNLPSTTTPINATNLNAMQSNVEAVFNGSEVMGNIVVDSIRSKNMFDKSTIVAGDISNNYQNIRLSSRQAIWLETGTYTFSTNITSTYQYDLLVENVGVPPLDSQPTFLYNSSWINNASLSFTISTAGWFLIYLRKTDNGTFTNTDITNLYSFNYQLEKGGSVTSYTPYQNLSPDVSDTGWVNVTINQGTWQYAQVRKIGKIVKFRAKSNSFGRSSGTIFTIPSGYRPSQQESAYGAAGWVSAPTISRWFFNTDGTCGMDWNLSLVNGTDITENTWKKIEATWFID